MRDGLEYRNSRSYCARAVSQALFHLDMSRLMHTYSHANLDSGYTDIRFCPVGSE